VHIVIVNRWPRYDDGVRWDNELTRYEEFLDHERNQVSYVVDGRGAAGVLTDSEHIAALVEVDDVNNYESLRAAVASITETVGQVDQLIALSEFTLGIAARVRESLGIPGPTPAEVAVYRDKVRMKEVLAAAGVLVPRFARCQSPEQATAFAAECGYPVIVKPVDGAASIGVHQVADEAALAALLPSLNLARYEIEEFVTGAIYHVDGFAGPMADVQFQVVARYVNDCLAFESGTALGSVVVRSSPLRERIEDFTRRCLLALGMRTMPFHLELFVTPDDELVFLEIGGRVGGAEVPYLLNRLFCVNLYEQWLRALTGTAVAIPAKSADPSGGWLTIPKPKAMARVVSVTSMAAAVPTIWRELIPRPGEIFQSGGSYDALHSGRYIFLHDDEAVVEADILRTIAGFRIETARMPDPGPPPPADPRRTVIFVDAFSTGAMLVREAAPDYRLVHVRSRSDLSPTFAASLPAQHFAEDLAFPGEAERVLARLALYCPIGVICGSEFGVEAADEIAAALGLRGNDPAQSAARRDKSRMLEVVAAAGVPTSRQHRGSDAADLLRWREAEGIGRVVIKPLDSAGSDDVYVCESGQEVIAAAGRVLGKKNLMLRMNDAVLIQEYLEGDEYIVNTVSRAGQHWFTDAWLSGKAVLAAGRKIYDFEDLLDPGDERLAQILPYIADVLDALGIREGPAHTELILTAAGPRLLETAARISGLANPAALDRATGANQVSLTLDCYLRGGAGLAGRSALYQRKAMARCVNLIAHREIPLPTRTILDALEQLPAFHDARFRVADAAMTRRTVDLNSSPGVVFLIHEDPAEIEKAYDSLRSIERELL